MEILLWTHLFGLRPLETPDLPYVLSKAPFRKNRPDRALFKLRLPKLHPDLLRHVQNILASRSRLLHVPARVKSPPFCTTRPPTTPCTMAPLRPTSHSTRRPLADNGIGQVNMLSGTVLLSTFTEPMHIIRRPLRAAGLPVTSKTGLIVGYGGKWECLWWSLHDNSGQTRKPK